MDYLDTALVFILIVIVCFTIGIVIEVLYAKIYMFTQVTIVSCDDINQTKCVIINESKDKREIHLEQKKSFSVENPSSNTA